ncbi:Na+/H+ antiporter subunit C [Paracoccus sp. p4-l81]|uniref:Na+/H+ antiporter subunit C n=1 Tax=unclassified Paracoccus (in: a-proteobacteria) TaxID=2688777 RepID=UPI0035B6D18D
MEALVAIAIGTLTAAAVYLILRLRSFAVILGTLLLSYAINIFLFASGRLVINRPAILDPAAPGYADPLPQALVLTAIVIAFGMTAVVVMMALGAFLEGGDDRIDMPDPVAPAPPRAPADRGARDETDPDQTALGAPEVARKDQP